MNGIRIGALRGPITAWFLVLSALPVFAALSTEAPAAAFTLGAGAELSQVLLPSSTAGQPQAAYLGPGLLLDMRMRTGGAASLGDFGADFFGSLELAYDTNSASSVSEACRLKQYAGGIDLRSSILFIGGQVAQTNATIFSSPLGATTPLTATSLGFRGGINWMLTEDASLMMGGVYQTGIAYAVDNGISANQPINQWSAFVLFHFKVVSQGSSLTGAKR